MARSFNNGTQYLSVSSTPVTAAPLTISTWFYAAATNDLYVTLFISDTGASNYFGLYINNAAAKTAAVACVSDSEDVIDSTTTFSVNTWNHTAAVFASSTSRSVYLNGGGKATSTNSKVPGSLNRINVGANFDSPSVLDPMNGRLAEVGIWNAALTDDEVTSLSKGVSPLKVRPASLVAYWPLYGNASPEPSYSRNSTDYSLTLNGSPTQVDHPPVSAPWAGSFGFLTAAVSSSNDTITVAKADVVSTGETVTVTDTIAVGAASAVFTGKSVIPTDVVTVGAASAIFTGKTVTLADTVLVSKSDVVFTGKTVTVGDAQIIPVDKADVAFTGKTVTLADTVLVSEADVVFTGKTVTLDDGDTDTPNQWLTFQDSDATDFGSNDTDGTLTGSPTFDTGVSPPALTLNGTTQYVSGTNHPVLGQTTNLTLCCWVNLTGTSLKGTFLQVGDPSAGGGFGDGFAIGVGDTTLDANGNNLVGAVDGIAWLPFAVAIGTGWHHIALTRDSTTWRGYVDGVVSGTTFTNSPAGSSSGWAIGRDVNGAPRLFAGKVQDARFYARQLSDAEIDAVYDAGPQSADDTTETIAVDAAAVTFTGKTVTVADTVAVGAASVAFTGKTVTVTDAVLVSKSDVVFTGQTVTKSDAQIITVDPAAVVFTGKTVTVADLLSVSAASIIFTGQTVTQSAGGPSEFPSDSLVGRGSGREIYGKGFGGITLNGRGSDVPIVARWQ
jgi:hypothetical protein